MTANPEIAAKRIDEYKTKYTRDIKGNPVPLKEVDPNDLYLPDSFLLNREKEKGRGDTTKTFITGHADEQGLAGQLTAIVQNKVNNSEVLDNDEFRQVIGILGQSKDAHNLLALLDLRILSHKQHAYLIKQGFMSNNQIQQENNERMAIHRMYTLISELKTNLNLTDAEKTGKVDGIKFEISREGYFPHRYIYLESRQC